MSAKNDVKNAKKVYKRKNSELFKCLNSMQRKRYNIFQKQNSENGHFDVTFEIEGKKLYAHKFILTSISEPLDSWLSDRWTSKDEVVKIEAYSYNNFYQFIRFLYLGKCALTEKNIFKITDMAEFYGVQYLKKFCDEFLADMKKTVEKIEELFDFAQKYSLSKLKKSIKKFFCFNVNKICISDAFISFKKPFIKFLFTADSNDFKNDIGFRGIYKWAEHRVLKYKSVDGDNNLNLHKAVKTELSTFLSHFYFPEMNFNFLMDFVVEKGFHLSPAQLFLFFKYKKDNDLEEGFKKTYELAEKQALKKQEALPEENFDLATSINAYMVDVITNVSFSTMSFNFLTRFVFEKGFLLSPADLSKYFLCLKDKRMDDEYSFNETYKLAEKLALKKQEMFPEDNFNLVNSVKTSLADMIVQVKFSKLKFEFLMDFVVEKGFLLSPAEIAKFFMNFKDLFGFEEDLLQIGFECTYKLAEKQALKKQEMFPEDNFNLRDTINAYLVDVIPNVAFSMMTLNFLMDFVVENGFLLSALQIAQVFINSIKNDILNLKLQNTFERTYKLAKKQALKKQEMFPEDNFILRDAVNAFLVYVIPNVAFSTMNKVFLTDFIVANKIISKEQAEHIFDKKVEIKNNGKIICGAFKDGDDEVGVHLFIQQQPTRFKCVTRQSTTKIRFSNLKFKIPTIPSSIQKMKGVDWYLCLEVDGILAFKHYLIVQKSDYLLAEMKSSEVFELTPGETTFLTAGFKNVPFP